MTDDSETYGGAQFVPEIDADSLSITGDLAARALTEPGYPRHVALTFWRNLCRKGLVHPYGRKRDGNRTLLFRADQLVIACVLHRLGEIGLENPALRQAVSLALHAWRGEDIGVTEDDYSTGNTKRDVPRSPAMWALIEHLNGTRDLSFQIRTLRCQKSGQVAHAARVCDAEGHGSNFPPQPESYAVRSALVIGLDDILAHITRAKATHETTQAVN